MKKPIKKIIITSAILVSVLLMLVVCSLVFRPIGNVVFSITLGSMYHKVGETTLKIAGKEESLTIYKAENKPFLILGPYLFGENYYDFFFVHKNQVIRTATDKGGDAWFRIANLLFLFDDMTGWDRVRMPYWDDIVRDPSSSVRLDDAAGVYIYSFKLDSGTTPQVIPVSFCIPAALFTADMPSSDHFVFNE